MVYVCVKIDGSPTTLSLSSFIILLGNVGGACMNVFVMFPITSQFRNQKSYSKFHISLHNSAEYPLSHLHNFEILMILARTSLNLRCFQAILMIQRCFLGKISFQTSKIMSKPT
ncbi:hypothetical protein HanXRQr2_Chr01g0011471 [Helianthus annuus]|uniref:Uncharacterized protein n=1 Tax=Helianthus annuus TaxID=4232 RepID=A0A9K3JU05_HELAN|nr:hypothetical protein HanXRQr2_Chr01g0011471 [Helianthus annuus]